MSFPSDFTKSWPSSDVVLIAKDAGDNKQELHATRTHLATFSSFFEGMFSSNFEEATSNSVEVSCSYETLKLILDIIYGLCRDYSKLKQTYEIDVLMELYKAADYLDIPLIRGLCVNQMMEQPSVEMATGVLSLVSYGLDLHDTLMTVIKKMNPDDLMRLISSDAHSELVFSKEDVVSIYETIAKKSLPSFSNYAGWTFKDPPPDFYQLSKDPPIDYTTDWDWHDVRIKTRNSEGEELHLYSCKTVLAMASPHYAELLFGPNYPGSEMVELKWRSIDHLVIKNILALVHHCYYGDDVDARFPGHVYMLYAMFCAAAEDKLNFPTVREFCVKTLKEVATYSSIHIDVSTRLTGAKPAILAKIKAETLAAWLHTGTNDWNCIFSKEIDGTRRVKYAKKNKPILSLSDVGIVVKKLLKEYNK